MALEVKATTDKWEEVLKTCKSQQVVYRGQVNGHPTYSPTWDSTWCVEYIPSKMDSL